MTSRKFANLEQEIIGLAMRPYMLSAKKAGFSNGRGCEASVYFLNPRKDSDTITERMRELVSKAASAAGLYTKFFAKDEFEEPARNMVWKEYSIENGIVVAFFPKYPFSYIKKMMRDVQESHRNSFAYLQEEEGALERMKQAKTLEKELIALSRKEPDYPVYTGAISDSPLYQAIRKLNDYRFSTAAQMTQQSEDIRSMCFLIDIR